MKGTLLSRYFFILIGCECVMKVCCQPSKGVALDFSLDSDGVPDKNNRSTHAFLQKENLPPSFTICTAFKVQAWTEYVNARLFILQEDNGVGWLAADIYALTSYTEFSFRFKDSQWFSNQSEFLFYPLQWIRVCLSKDSDTTRLVADGELMVERQVEVKNNPDNLNLVLGLDWDNLEYPGQTTNLNIFSTALSVKQMKSQTYPGKVECGRSGDFLSWEKSLEEEQWTLHSKARWVDFDDELEGPCRTKTKINVFPMNDWHHQRECMKHCKKLGGHSPSLITKTEWENLLKDAKALTPYPSKLPKYIWLSTTEGDTGLKLGSLDHWPVEVKAGEGVWRNYYTGDQLENYTKPWLSSNGDKDLGDTYNCVMFELTGVETRAWEEWQCWGHPRGCPCTYDSPPLINLKGFCPDTLLEHQRYTVVQWPYDPNNIIMIGSQSAQIEYNTSLSQWMYSDPRLNLTATSRASQNSYALGKHNWTVSGDNYKCSVNKDYTREMKLTGCNETHFTCNNGECVEMEKRCNQMCMGWEGAAQVGEGEEGGPVGGAEPGDPSLAGEDVLPMKLRVCRLGICLLVSVQLLL